MEMLGLFGRDGGPQEPGDVGGGEQLLSSGERDVHCGPGTRCVGRFRLRPRRATPHEAPKDCLNRRSPEAPYRVRAGALIP